jgi:hypothetical protein
VQVLLDALSGRVTFAKVTGEVLLQTPDGRGEWDLCWFFFLVFLLFLLTIVYCYVVEKFNKDHLDFVPQFDILPGVFTVFELLLQAGMFVNGLDDRARSQLT